MAMVTRVAPALGPELGEKAVATSGAVYTNSKLAARTKFWPLSEMKSGTLPMAAEAGARQLRLALDCS